jgi:type VI protein secretion system component VasK
MKKIFTKIKNFFSGIGTLNIILIVVGCFFVWFNWQMLDIYRSYGSIPETYAVAVIGSTIGEAGICGWIRTNKDKRQERIWKQEDAKKESNNTDFAETEMEDMR